jgi:SAM-dependent methyltransferase
MDRYELSVKRFDEFASEYAERFANIDAYRKHIDQFCARIPGHNPAILELACGPANVTSYLKQRFPDSRIVALDLSPRMIAIARQVVRGVDFRIMDVRKIHSLELQFDAIMCSFCLPFLSKEDTDKLIIDCAGRLKDKGILYISTMEGDESRAGFESTCFSGDAKVYFNYHLQNDLKRALTANGFSVAYAVRQDYDEPDGSTTVDLILVAEKQTNVTATNAIVPGFTLPVPSARPIF